MVLKNAGDGVYSYGPLYRRMWFLPNGVILVRCSYEISCFLAVVINSCLLVLV